MYIFFLFESYTELQRILSSKYQRGLQQEDKICPGQIEEVWQRRQEGESREENPDEVSSNIYRRIQL